MEKIKNVDTEKIDDEWVLEMLTLLRKGLPNTLIESENRLRDAEYFNFRKTDIENHSEKLLNLEKHSKLLNPFIRSIDMCYEKKYSEEKLHKCVRETSDIRIPGTDEVIKMPRNVEEMSTLVINYNKILNYTGVVPEEVILKVKKALAYFCNLLARNYIISKEANRDIKLTIKNIDKMEKQIQNKKKIEIENEEIFFEFLSHLLVLMDDDKVLDGILVEKEEFYKLKKEEEISAGELVKKYIKEYNENVDKKSEYIDASKKALKIHNQICKKASRNDYDTYLKKGKNSAVTIFLVNELLNYEADKAFKNQNSHDYYRRINEASVDYAIETKKYKDSSVTFLDNDYYKEILGEALEKIK